MNQAHSFYSSLKYYCNSFNLECSNSNKKHGKLCFVRGGAFIAFVLNGMGECKILIDIHILPIFVSHTMQKFTVLSSCFLWIGIPSQKPLFTNYSQWNLMSEKKTKDRNNCICFNQTGIIPLLFNCLLMS